MALPTFNGFSLQDSNFITERRLFRGYAEREVIRGKINRREGVKILATEMGGKEITLEGVIIADSASHLQTLLDNMKKAFMTTEANLIIEQGRTFMATVLNLAIPDEHYNQSRAPWEITFLCSNPYAEGVQVVGVIPVPSGTVTVSGTVTISGTFFNRPSIKYTPPSSSGDTNISRLDLYHVNTGQTTTVSGFGEGTKLDYQDEVTINLDTFISLEGASAIGNSGSFPKWEPGVNQFTLTATNGVFPGGSITVTHNPRYL